MERGVKRLTPTEFGLLYEQSARTLWCVAAAIIGDRSRAEDVVQEAAVVALGKLETFEPSTNFTAWMAQIVRYCALNESRKRRADEPIDPDALESVGASGNAADGEPVTARGELKEDAGSFDDAVLRALLRLEPNARACVLLRIVLNLSYAEIAGILGIPEGTAMSHVYRSRQAMREHLKREGQGGAHS